ncbi:hypothetical protein LZ30DRAFT_717900 [Colletotrichum cereale]|nr:hypothetical protein LZ30DRAFT_717900 [Colletotrichum cereale]
MTWRSKLGWLFLVQRCNEHIEGCRADDLYLKPAARHNKPDKPLAGHESPDGEGFAPDKVAHPSTSELGE